MDIFIYLSALAVYINNQQDPGKLSEFTAAWQRWRVRKKMGGGFTGRIPEKSVRSERCNTSGLSAAPGSLIFTRTPRNPL